MRKIKQLTIIIVLGFAILLYACSDFMDIVPSTSYTEEMVFTDAALTQAFVNDCTITFIREQRNILSTD